MLELSRIDELALAAARAALPRAGVTRVTSRPFTDWTGEDALEVLIVLTSDAPEDRTPDSAMDVLRGINDSLQQAGEERFPYLRYTTEADLLARKEAEEADHLQS
jgi:hypothetical protein